MEIKEKYQEVQEKQEEREEVKERGRGEKKERADRSRSSSGTAQFGATDKRCREVKNLPETIMKSHDP